jgi:hypothetical protein
MAINKINSLALGSVAKVNSLLKASMAKINSLVNVLFGDSYSIELDGTNDGITAHPVAEASLISGEIGSVSCWFKLDTVSSGKHLFCFTENNTLGDNFIRAFYHASRNQLYSNHRGNGTQMTIIASNTVENNGWHHYALTWNTGGDTITQVYIDGSSAGTAEGTTAMAFEEEGINTVHIGTKDGSNNPWLGHVNDFALYSDVLSSAEVSEIYNSGSPNDLTGLGSASGLVAYWKMENNTDDSSSNSNPISLVNGAAYSSDTP